jgi:hypothetical protein
MWLGTAPSLIIHAPHTIESYIVPAVRIVSYEGGGPGTESAGGDELPISTVVIAGGPDSHVLIVLWYD